MFADYYQKVVKSVPAIQEHSGNVFFMMYQSYVFHGNIFIFNFFLSKQVKEVFSHESFDFTVVF